MLKEHEALFRRLLSIFDLILVALCFFLAHFLRDILSRFYDFEALTPLYPIETYFNLLPLLLLLWAAALHGLGAYQPLRGKNLFVILGSILKAGMLATILFAGIAYLLKWSYLSRSFISFIFALSVAAIMLSRLVLMQILSFARRRGYNYRYLLIVGTGKRAQRFIQSVHEHPEWGLRIAGLMDRDVRLKGEKIMGERVLGTLLDLPHLLNQKIIDEVIFIVPRNWLAQIEEAVLYCEQVGKRVSIAMDLFTMQFTKARQSSLGDLPLLMFQSTTDKVLQLGLKRLLDILVSALGLIVLFPFLLIVALIVKVSSKGPVFFVQKRVSLNGRIFSFYKFRTMRRGAEKRQRHLARFNEMSGPAFKMSRDPRVTGLGRWMRKFSVDELPQLWNVLRGDMSIVGPRPPIPREVKKYKPWQRRRLSMRPGLTCLWQIEGRNKIVKFDRWMALDLEYIDQWSLWLDFKIFMKTIPIVLFGIGAQ